MKKITLSQLATISSEVKDPDFYIRKKGSQKSLGDISKNKPEESPSSSWFGIKLNDLGRKYLDPDYLYYLMMNVQAQGVWAQIAIGSTKLVHIRKEDIGSLTFEIPDDEPSIEKESSSNLLKIKKNSNRIFNLFKLASGDSSKMEALAKFLGQKIERISSRERIDIGKHTYIVGGAIRNFILEKDIKDIDIVIDSVSLGGFNSARLAEELQREISVNTEIGTNNYGVAILSIKGPLIIDGHNFAGEQIEIANARNESYSGEGYKPEGVSPATIEEDVFRREFTFNTLMWRIVDIATGFDKAEIIDITGCGMDDLKSGEVRCPKDPDIVFSDDPSRMLRAVKFISKYGFRLPDDVRESIERNSDKIKNIPPNQIGSILINQILTEPSYRSSLLLMSSLKLLNPIRDMLAAPQTKDESALKSFILSHSKEREVDFLLSLLEVNLPLSEPLKFLTEEQRERLGEITSGMSAEDGWNFVGMLSNPGDAVKDRDFFNILLAQFVKNKKDTPIFVNTIYKPTVIDILLSDPEIRNDKAALKESIIREIGLKVNL